MIRALFSFLFLFILGNAFGQAFSNEWINTAQQYYKISVNEDGMYRLTHADLSNAGIPIGSIDPRRLQLFHRGVEQAIHVEGQQDAVFNLADHITFFGQQNDGALDEQLYVDPAAQPHKYRNLYSDTTAYFLTWNFAGINGKRMSFFKENNVDGLPVEAYHTSEKLEVRSDQYFTGASYDTYIQLTAFDYAEGFTGVQLQENEQKNYTLTGINNTYTAGPKPTVEVLLVGRDDKSHNVEILVGQNAGALRSLGTVQFIDFETNLFNSTIEWSDISASGEVVVSFNVLGVSGENDRASLSYIKLNFPSAIDMTGVANFSMNTRVNSGGKSYIEVPNTPTSLSIYDITDANEVTRIGYNNLTGSINAIVPNTDAERNLLLISQFLSPLAISQSSMSPIPTNAEYIIISHKSLMNSGNPVQAYANYRSSDAGGDYSTVVLEISALYDQFSYGEYSPLAIHKLMEYLHANAAPKYVFIIGKGLLPGSKSGGVFYRDNPDGFAYKDLVPVAGNPGSDINYTLGLDGVTNEMTIPIGRITVSKPAEVTAYLNKVKEMESASFNSLWRKDILHLTGGVSSNELTRFAGYMEGFETIAEGDFLGGNVITKQKQSTGSVEFINTTDQVNQGLNLITFFGHSAPSITDIDIGYASDPVHGYNNQGKYPFILVNGCNAGQVFSNNYLWGEDWVIAPDKGAIGFIAHSFYGYETSLREYSNVFYRKAYGDAALIHKSIGTVQQEVIKQFIAENGTSERDLTQAHQMILVGDPAVSMFPAPFPDYETSDDQVYFQPYIDDKVDALVDSFAVAIITRNFGKTDADPVKVRVERIYENNSVEYYDSAFYPVYYQDTLLVTIKNNSQFAGGRNQFNIMLDYPNDEEELNEANNSASIEIELSLNGTKNLFPKAYGIVNTNQVDLVVQSSNALVQGERSFDFEIDTEDTFDSPFYKSETISANILAKWSTNLLPNIPKNDSVVYYWRTRFTEPTVGESEEWVQSSFTFIDNGESGWTQRTHAQVSEDQIVNLEYDPQSEQYEFKTTQSNVVVKTYGANHPTLDRTDVELSIDGEQYIYSERYCRDNTINLVAFNKESLLPYAALPRIFQDTRTCGRTDQVINSFLFNEISQSGDANVPLSSGTKYLEHYIDSLADGDFVVAFTQGNVSMDSWSPELVSQLERIGASAATINNLNDNEPLILYGRKGMTSGEALEVIASAMPFDQQAVEINEELTGVYGAGSIVSPLIGPATQWKNLEQFVTTGIENTTDYSFEISGFDFEGTKTTLMNGVIDKTVSLAAIDAQQYPYLQLTLHLDDDEHLTASALNHWMVTFEAPAEGILLPGENEYGIEKEEGEAFTTNFKFVNISQQSFTDSLLVEVSHFNQSQRTSFESVFKISPPAIGDTTNFIVTTQTREKVGLNDLEVFVNPFEQPEIYYDNNTITFSDYFNVKGDESDPLLDVLFDGVRIFDGDIVAASPTISISLHDIKSFNYKTDTTGMHVFIKEACDGCSFERIDFSSSQLSWKAADATADFQMEYTPERFEDGTYTLRIVAEDAAGNASGDEPFQINFQVVNETSITKFKPYPNPFSTNVQFVFTLTGNDIPDEINIQIFSLSGRVIREITQATGALHIGENVGTYSWDGRDADGNQMPNGMYLYRVMIKNEGKTLKPINPTGHSDYNHDVGKLYLLR